MEYKFNKDMSREAEFHASNFEEDDESVGATTYIFNVYVDINGEVEVLEKHTGHTLGCFYTEFQRSWYNRYDSFFEVLQAILKDYKYIW